MLRHLNNDGSFVYEYNPITGKRSDSYNILRHAGTAYTLAELYGYTGDKKYILGAEKALLYLKKQIKPCPNNLGPACVVEAGETKLGGNALAVLAFTKYMAVTGTRKYVQEAKQLTDFILNTQSKTGEFLVHKIYGDTVDSFRSRYYPGEAIFALVSLYNLNRDSKFVDAAHRGALWLTVRDATIPDSKLILDQWLLYGLNELHENNNDERYVKYAKRFVNIASVRQHNSNIDEEIVWNGGYGNPPRGTLAAIIDEGLGAAYYVFLRSRDSEYASKTLEILKNGIRFQLHTQYTAENIVSLKANPAGLGGFRNYLDEYTVRIDYTHHSISALLGLAEIVRDHKP